MSESLESYWDQWESAAQARDDRRRDASLGLEPPILADLIKSSRSTALRRLFPFTSHDRLCFSTAPDSAGPSAPAFVILNHDHGYVVYAGHPYREGSTIVLRTHSAAEAATEVERLLAGWPERDG